MIILFSLPSLASSLLFLPPSLPVFLILPNIYQMPTMSQILCQALGIQQQMKRTKNPAFMEFTF